MMWKEFSKDYLSFSRKDKIGAIVLLGFILLFSFLPRVLSFFSVPVVQPADSTLKRAIRTLENNTDSTAKNYNYTNYKNKRYSRPAYGPSAFPKRYSREKDYYPRFDNKAADRNFTIDINTADTTAFIALPGIGSKLASRIISFREKLGGFFSVEQVKETYGIHDSVFQKIKPFLKNENFVLRKININSATLEELRAHPYIRWNLANPIIAYRNEHGSFTSIDELQNVFAITPEIYNKLRHYLNVE